MPQTTDQLRAAILNLPCKPPALTASAEVWAYQYGHRDARHAAAELVSAAPLVAEAPREIPHEVRMALDRMCSPLHKSLLRGVTASEDARCMKVIRDYIERAAPPVSLAPMPEEWLTDDQIQRLAREAVGLDPMAQGKTIEITFSRDALFRFARSVSHLRTAPLTLSDEDSDDYGLSDDEFLDANGMLKGIIKDVLASVAPQPEQPNTDSVHLADNGRKPVQGLDAALAPRYYCNKCGSFPDAVQHKRPDGTDCPYIARTTHGVALPRADQPKGGA